jgi:NADPH:quinone reductase-like Zn-dependent oxidoreductase
MTLGFDVWGVIDRVGNAVTGFTAGQDVVASLGGPSLAGGYAEYAVTPAHFVAKKPSYLTFTDAASIPLAALAALQRLRRVGLDRDRTALIAGGAGGVESWAILHARAQRDQIPRWKPANAARSHIAGEQRSVLRHRA